MQRGPVDTRPYYGMDVGTCAHLQREPTNLNNPTVGLEFKSLPFKRFSQEK